MWPDTVEDKLRQMVNRLVQRHFYQIESDTFEVQDKQVRWSHYQARAKKTAAIDYDCQFQEGRCKQYRNDVRPEAERACCACCAHALGYLNHIPRGTSWTYARLFDGVTGFWRQGQGCILPREMRSPTCLSYNCHKENWGKLNVWKFLISGETSLIQIALVKKEAAK